MPRGKRAVRGNQHKGPIRGNRQRGGPSARLHELPEQLKREEHNGFTLQQEAQNTGRHHNLWESDHMLRHTRVNFISAGALEPDEAEEEIDPPKLIRPESALADMTLLSPEAEVVVEMYEEESEMSQARVWPGDNCASEGDQVFFFDTTGTVTVDTGLTVPQLRATSPTASDSSEEVILFGGRDQYWRGLSRTAKLTNTVTDPVDFKIKTIDDKIHEKEEVLESILHGQQSIDDHRAASDAQSQVVSTTAASSHKSLTRTKNSRKKSRRQLVQHMEDQEAEIIADYMANIEQEDSVLMQEAFSRRELGGVHDIPWHDPSESELSLRESDRGPRLAGWDRDDIVDFDDVSTSDGVMGEVKEILSKRLRSSGYQYLVVWDGQAIDEARWVPVATLSSMNALLHLENFEAKEQLVAESMGLGDDDSYGTDETGLSADVEDYERADIVPKDLSDEQIARLLAKQEELGMGSDELLLFDSAGLDEDTEIPPSDLVFHTLGSRPRNKAEDRRSTRRPGNFPAATKLADAYDGFDVMGFERPSLKEKPKGRRGRPEFDLTDSELEESMLNAWVNDRSKKRARKQEREELRAQGLLGSKNGNPDLKQKYREGMPVNAVRDEIKQFLMGNSATLALPPMDKANRKVVHELANAFKLKSKSAGSGKKRFPVLHKTQQTKPYLEQNFDAVEARITHRFLPRMDVGGSRASSIRKLAGQGGSYSSAAVSYRDGDVVGGSAPELGAENRGRAMLEKMGWSTGTALGALNNKGILQPVSHVVKTTKAGLG